MGTSASVATHSSSNQRANHSALSCATTLPHLLTVGHVDTAAGQLGDDLLGRSS